jgi:DNA repair protein RecO (recombination protein O)
MSKSAPALPAYVLHQWSWSESSLIVELFTRGEGRIVVVARGAKRPTSNLRPVLLPFQRLTVALGKPARSTLDKDQADEVLPLRAAEWAGGAPMPPAAALMSAFYCNELLMKLLARADPHPRLFDTYAATLGSLGAAAAGAGNEALTQAALRAFELMLLRETGVLPDLSLATLTAQPLQAGERYELRAELGLVGAAAGGEAALAGACWCALQTAIDAGDLAALQAEALAARGALRPALRAVLAYHLGHAPLRTRAVMHSMQRLLDPKPPR